MKFEITHRWNNNVKVIIEGLTRNEAIKQAIKDKVDLRDSNLSGSNLRDSNLSGSNLRDSNLRDSNLSGSNLRDSDLRGSDLRDSNLSGSNLRDSDLSGSNLRGSNLRGSDLSGSDLRGSNLSGSDLSGSNLRGSNLRGSNLSGSTTLPGAVTWKEYLDEVVPAFLQAGGKSLIEVANPETWNCHSWTNCPTHAAFNANTLADVPALYRPIANQFIQFFDAGLIPLAAIRKDLAPAAESVA